MYNALVRKNGRVWYEYERYVREHMVEYHQNRFARLKILFKLNWFYRVKKGNTPYLYWDTPLIPEEAHNSDNGGNKSNISDNKPVSNVVLKKNNDKGAPKNNIKKGDAVNKANSNNGVMGHTIKKNESSKYICIDTVHFAKEMERFPYVLITLSNTLFIPRISDRNNYFEMLGKEFGIPMFYKVCELAEEECIRKYGQYAYGLEELYTQVCKYVEIDIPRVIQRDRELMRKNIEINQYVKNLYVMATYNDSRVYLIDDTIYDKDLIQCILLDNGLELPDQFVLSNEKKISLVSGKLYSYLNEYLNNEKCIVFDSNQERLNLATYYMDAKPVKCNDVIELGEKNWEIRKSNLQLDLFSSLVASKMYTGVRRYVRHYEIGYNFFGPICSGLKKWVHNKIYQDEVDLVLIDGDSGNFWYKPFEESLGKGIQMDLLWMTEVTAAKIISIKYPYYMLEYVEKYMTVGRTILFLLEKMDLFFLEDDLKKMSVDVTKTINKESLEYELLVNTFLDNYDAIIKKYKNDVSDTIEFLQKKEYKAENVAIFRTTNVKTLTQAMKIIFKDYLHSNINILGYEVIEIDDACYEYDEGDVSTFIDNRIVKRYEPYVVSRIQSVFGNVAPIFEKISKTASGFEFKFESARPDYNELFTYMQKGILDFCKEYEKSSEELKIGGLKSPDVALILSEGLKDKEYLTKGIPFRRS